MTSRLMLSSALRAWSQTLSPLDQSVLRAMFSPPKIMTNNASEIAASTVMAKVLSTGLPDADLLPAYLAGRSWPYSLPERPATIATDNGHTLALLSHLLTFPLTLSYLSSKGLLLPSTPTSTTLTATASRARVCVVGARAESTLPPAIWSELQLPNSRPLTLDFLGPEIKQTQQSQLNNPPPEASATTFTYTKGMLDEIETVDLLDVATFVLFNPGVGHPHLQEGWKKALLKMGEVRAQQQQGRGGGCATVIITCHSEYDLARDVPILEANFEGVKVLGANPFCSRRGDEDPKVEGGVVNANCYIVTVG